MHEPDNPTPAPSVDLPRFAVVGHPNKGKSSVVATLAQNDSIAIAMEPGTTRASHRYPMTVDEVTLYERLLYTTDPAAEPLFFVLLGRPPNTH